MRGDATTSPASPLQSRRSPGSARNRGVSVHRSVSHAPARQADRDESSNDGSPAPPNALDPFASSGLRSPVIVHPQPVCSAWLSNPVSSRCAAEALIIVSWRTATSRTSTLRVKTTFANGCASSSGRFERRAPLVKSPSKSNVSRLRYQETVVLLDARVPIGDENETAARSLCVLDCSLTLSPSMSPSRSASVLSRLERPKNVRR